MLSAVVRRSYRRDVVSVFVVARYGEYYYVRGSSYVFGAVFFRLFFRLFSGIGRDFLRGHVLSPL